MLFLTPAAQQEMDRKTVNVAAKSRRIVQQQISLLRFYTLEAVFQTPHVSVSPFKAGLRQWTLRINAALRKNTLRRMGHQNIR